MKEVKAYESSDGKVFLSEKECLVHEKGLQFIQWYDGEGERELYAGGFAEAVNVWEYLMEHKDVILDFLKD